MIGVLQGLGILETEYYTSATGYSRIETDWAISVLGPNHTHLGTYMALAIAFSVMNLQYRFRLKYVLAILLFLGALGFSHSAVGFGMVGLYVMLAFLKGGTRMKTIALAIGVIGIIFLIIYMSGITGESSVRTAEKYSIKGEDSEIVVRTLVRPFNFVLEAADQFPQGLLFGFGFKVAYLIAPDLPPTGDNNYFSVVMDVGLIGFMLYLVFLTDIYKRTKRAASKATTKYAIVFTFHMHVWFRVVLIAMFVQEMLWPLHSRGSTMLVFLALLEVSAMMSRSDKVTQNKRFIEGRDKRVIERRVLR